MKLSILICSILQREVQLKILLEEFYKQRIPYVNEVEILTEVDNKEISIGAKRQKLLERAIGDWIVYFDDDDVPSLKYIEMIYSAIVNNKDIDCIGIRGLMTTNGINPKTWCHRLGFPIAGDGINKTGYGYDYARPIIHFNPVLHSKAIQAGFRDMRYGEDMDYADRLNKLLTKEYFIDDQLFHYNYSDKTLHNQKYGING